MSAEMNRAVNRVAPPHCPLPSELPHRELRSEDVDGATSTPPSCRQPHRWQSRKDSESANR